MVQTDTFYFLSLCLNGQNQKASGGPLLPVTSSYRINLPHTIDYSVLSADFAPSLKIPTSFPISQSCRGVSGKLSKLHFLLGLSVRLRKQIRQELMSTESCSNLRTPAKRSRTWENFPSNSVFMNLYKELEPKGSQITLCGTCKINDLRFTANFI